MKTIFKACLILFLTLSSATYAQGYKSEIKSEFNNYLNLIVTKQFDKSMDYLIPEFFEMFPREQMVAMMEQVFNSPDMKFEIKDPKILEVNNSEEIDGKYYALLTYSNKMNMKLTNSELNDESEEDKKMYLDLMKASLKQSFGEENVKYNEETSFFEIYSEKKVCAISNNGTSDWKFLVLEKGQEMLLGKLLPKQIVEKF